MRIVGNRKERKITFHSTTENLKAGMQWNKTVADFFSGSGVYVFFPKGVYHYKSYEEAERHQFDCLIKGIVKLERQRRDGKVTSTS